MISIRPPVQIKGTKDGLNLVISPIAKFSDVRRFLRKQFSGASGKEIHISFSGKSFSPLEYAQLEETICCAVSENASITFGKAKPFSYQELVASLRPEEQIVTHHHGMVRSGQKVHARGTLMICGNVNRGGEVSASGDVIVLGTLAGIAHAGIFGDITRTIYAAKMMPLQLRIADVFLIPKKQTETIQTIAYVEENMIHRKEIGGNNGI